jgi:acyl-CoA reductase-like NAD-dependent aldehyde dehydrogenase
MAVTSSQSFPQLLISRLEGRAQSPLYKQGQFHRLYDELKVQEDSIKAAIRSDTGDSATEVDIEFALTLSELRIHHGSINLQVDLDAERKVETGRDNISRALPFGIVYIVPTTQNLLYSVISALCAALAAGNCIILEVRILTSDTFQA